MIFGDGIFHHPYERFVGGLSQAISLRIIGSVVPDNDIELMVEAGELGRFEDLSIVCDNFEGTTKVGEYVLLHEFYHH